MFLDIFIIKLKSIYAIIFSKLLCSSENIFVMGLKLTAYLISNSETFYKGRVNLHLGTLNDACFKSSANIILASYPTCTPRQQD